MNLVVIAAFIAVCGAATLDRTYLPPSAASAGGSPGSLKAPLTRTSEQGLDNANLPTGSFTNDFGGVVVEAAAPGTRSSEGLSGLGGPRPSYGTSNSKVGDAAFRGSAPGFRGPSGQIEDASGHFENRFKGNSQIDSHTAQGFPSIGQSLQTGQFSNFQDENKSERPQAAKDRNSNIISLSNDVNADSYSYGFETDNGIAVGENGVDVNGIQAEGGYSYQGDDGQVYKVTYVADEKGYRPQGAHLPTSPPIPEEILKSLEQNAKAEAAGIVDDGSYDAEKYNADSDYTHDNSGNNQYNRGQSSQFEKRPVSSTFNLNKQAFESTGVPSFASNTQDFNGQSSQVNGQTVGATNTFGPNKNQGILSQFGISVPRPNHNGQATQVNSQSGSTQFGSQPHSAFGQSSQKNQFESGVPQNINVGHNSHSSQTVHESSTGQAFGKTENKFSSSGHTQDAFGSPSQFGSQFGQQASASAQFENQALVSASMQNQQELNTQFSSSSKPTNDQYHQDAIDSAHSQSTQPESGTSFKPQGSEAFSGASLNQNQDAQDFGKPFPQIFSGENHNRPSSGNFNRIPTFGQSQVNRGSANSVNRFSQTSGQFAAQNEYLPPSSNGQPIQSQASGVTSNTGISGSGQEPQKGGISDFVALNRPKPNFASGPTSTMFKQPQPATISNAFVTQPKPSQFNQQSTQFTSQTSQPSSQSQTEFNINSQQSGSLATQTVTDIGTKPTTVPDTELTTPLEPNEKPVSQGSQFSSQTTSSFGSSNSKPASQGQTQFGFQGNSAFGQSTSQTLSPNAPTSSPQTSSQFGTASTQLAFQSSGENRPENLNQIPQFNLNSFGQNQQNEPSSSQVIDNSYYYNQPPKAFGVPTSRPQASRFPSSPSYQSNGVAQSQFFNQKSFQTPTKFSASSSPVRATSATQSVQSQGYNGITQAAASSFPSAFPTQSSQVGMTQTTQFGSMPNIIQQSSTGNQAQSAAAAPTSYNQQSTIGNRFQEIDNKKEPTITTLPVARFPPNLQIGLVGTETHSMETLPSFNQQPTFSNQAKVTGQENHRFSQFPTSKFPSGQKPVSTGSQTETRFDTSKTPESSEDSSQQSTQTQQYQGTIYEYNKPAEVPATQTDSSSDPINTSSISKPSFGQSQSTQLISQQGLKPTSQVSETDSKSGLQSNKAFGSSSSFQFGQKAQTSQGSQVSHASETQFNIQPAKPLNAPLPITNIEFSQSAQSGDQTNRPYGALATSAQFGQTAQSPSDGSSLQQNNQGLQTAESFKPFGSASQSSQSPFRSQTNRFSQSTQLLGNSESQPQKKGAQPQSSFQNFQNSASSNGYFYPGNPKLQFGEESKNLFNSQPGRPQTGVNNQFNFAQQGNSQPTSGFNQQSQLNSASRPQFGAQNNKNTQAIFGQRVPSSPIQPFSQPQFGPSATSQAFATGPTASASATSEPKPYYPQDMTQFSNSQDQNGQSTHVGVQSTKPFGTQESKEPRQPFGSYSQGSKPLFNSACCQASKDSTSAQSTDRPSSFSGAQSSSQTFAGKGEQFDGTRQPPKFDEQTGYHY